MLVVFEGLDKAGKSTLAEAVEKALPVEASVYREPGGTGLGVELRELLLQHKCQSDLIEALLFTASRFELYKSLKMEKHPKHIYLFDRYVFSTAVYQRNAAYEDATLFNALLFSPLIPVPDLIFYIRIEPGARANRLDVTDMMELKNRAMLFQDYERMMEQLPNVVTIDGLAPIESNVELIVKEIMKEYMLRFENDKIPQQEI